MYLCRMRLFSLLALMAIGIMACESEASLPSLSSSRTNVSPPVLDPALQAFVEEYDEYVQASLDATSGPGAALVIVKDSQVIFQKGYGFRDASTGAPVTLKTIFRIGSLSKGFAGVLAGVLVQQNVLRWEEKVRAHLPAFRLKDAQQSDRIQLRHLLSHTTGLPYHAYTHLIEQGLDLPEIMKGYFPKSPVCGKEGEFYAYQNAAFCIAGTLMQSVTGESYTELLKKRILNPAGMSQTSCSYEGIQSAPDKALPHVKSGNHWVTQPIERSYYNAVEAGGINANIEDMGKWLLVLLGHRPDIISNQALEEVFHPVVKTGKERKIQGGWISREEASYAMGWRVLEHGGQTILYHGGFVNGFRGEIAMDRTAGIGVCLLFNGPTDLSSECIQAFFERYKAAMVAKTDTLYGQVHHRSETNVASSKSGPVGVPGWGQN